MDTLSCLADGLVQDRYWAATNGPQRSLAATAGLAQANWSSAGRSGFLCRKMPPVIAKHVSFFGLASLFSDNKSQLLRPISPCSPFFGFSGTREQCGPRQLQLEDPCFRLGHSSKRLFFACCTPDLILAFPACVSQPPTAHYRPQPLPRLPRLLSVGL